MKTMLLTVAEFALRKVLGVGKAIWTAARDASADLDKQPDLTPEARHAVLDAALAGVIPCPEGRKRVIQAVVLARRIRDWFNTPFVPGQTGG